MTRRNKGFTLIELLIVVVIVGILALAAVPLFMNNTRDARRSEGERMLGAARDFCRTEYSKSGNEAEVSSAFAAEAATGSFDGHYFDVTTFSDTSSVGGMDASLTTDNTADGQGTIDFAWDSGTSKFNWS